MKRLLAILLLSCPLWAQIQAGVLSPSSSVGGGGAPIWVLKNSQSGNCSSVATCGTAAFSNSLTNGSIIIVAIYDLISATGPYSVTDTAGNTYSSQGPGVIKLNSDARMIQAFCAPNTHTTASNVVTMAPTSGTMSFPRIVAFEFTGRSSCTLDGGVGVGYSSLANAVSSSGGSNTLSSTSFTTLTNGDLIMAVYGTVNANITAGTSPNAFTLPIAGTGGLGMEYFVQTSAGAIQPTASDSVADSYANISLAFK